MATTTLPQRRDTQINENVFEMAYEQKGILHLHLNNTNKTVQVPYTKEELCNSSPRTQHVLLFQSCKFPPELESDTFVEKHTKEISILAQAIIQIRDEREVMGVVVTPNLKWLSDAVSKEDALITSKRMARTSASTE